MDPLIHCLPLSRTDHRVNSVPNYICQKQICKHLLVPILCSRDYKHQSHTHTFLSSAVHISNIHRHSRHAQVHTLLYVCTSLVLLFVCYSVFPLSSVVLCFGPEALSRYYTSMLNLGYTCHVDNDHHWIHGGQRKCDNRLISQSIIQS